MSMSSTFSLPCGPAKVYMRYGIASSTSASGGFFNAFYLCIAIFQDTRSAALRLPSLVCGSSMSFPPAPANADHADFSHAMPVFLGLRTLLAAFFMEARSPPVAALVTVFALAPLPDIRSHTSWFRPSYVRSNCRFPRCLLVRVPHHREVRALSSCLLQRHSLQFLLLLNLATNIIKNLLLELALKILELDLCAYVQDMAFASQNPRASRVVKVQGR